MSRGAKYSVGIVLAALALVVPQILLAQGELTLEGLAKQVGILFESREESDSRISTLEPALLPRRSPVQHPLLNLPERPAQLLPDRRPRIQLNSA